MKFNLDKVTRALHKVGFVAKQHAPELLLAGGIISGGVCVYQACKATLKVNEVLEETKENVEKIHEATEKGVTEAGKEYSEKDSKKDLFYTYVQTGGKLLKLYGPAIAFGTVSVTSILASNNIMRKRTVALAAAYTAIDTNFKEYRGRVVERFGERTDQELRYNIKATQVEKTVTSEDGTESTITETIDVVDKPLSEYSEFAKFFDELNVNWKSNAEYNLKFLLDCQEYANRKLRTQGHLFLNEVYEMLGIPTTEAGQVVGWIYDIDCPIGDNKVDFGIYDVHSKSNREFVNGYEKSILLDFNVDGYILDKAW